MPPVLPSPPLLDVQNLAIDFAAANGPRPAVAGISFQVNPGEVFGLVGESGSGKSATSLAILRLLSPSATICGAINFAGSNLLTLPENSMRSIRGREIAMIFQEPMTALNPAMSVGAQIAEAICTHQPSLTTRAVRERVHTAMDEVALPDPVRRARDYPHQFSGGQRQRVLIAMALVHRPRLLIADEPTTALDVTVQAQILDLLMHLRRTHSLAMLFISHDLAVVSQLAERVAVMRSGRIIETGPSRDLFHAPQHPYTLSLIAAVPTMRTRRDQPLAIASPQLP